MTNNEQKQRKKHFPRVNKCWCCCCLDYETAIKVCTILLIICHVYNAFRALRGSGFYTFLISAGVATSLVFLYTGIEKKNVKYMSQFLYVYLAYLILETIGLVFAIVIIALFFISGANNMDQLNSYTYGLTDSYSSNDTWTFFLIVFIIIFVFYIVSFGLEVYYYICTGSYVEETIDEIERNAYTRELEVNAN